MEQVPNPQNDQFPSYVSGFIAQWLERRSGIRREVKGSNLVEVWTFKGSINAIA